MINNADPAEIFRQEAADLLEQLEQALLDLDRNPEDRDLVNTAFRALHTIKGSGAMFGFEDVAAFAHEFESAFDRVRKGETPPDHELVAIALNAKDFIRAQIEKPEETDAVIGVCILADLRQLVAARGSVPDVQMGQVQETAAADAAEAATYRIRIRFNKDVLVNGTNPLLLLSELRDLGECAAVCHADAVPTLSEIEPTACYFHWDVVLKTTYPRSAIDDVFIFVQDDMSLDVQRIGAGDATRSHSQRAGARGVERSGAANGRGPSAGKRSHRQTK